MPEQDNNEFSRPVKVDGMEPGGEIRRTIEADAAERKALAKRLGIIGLDSLTAEVAVRRIAGGKLFSVEGRITAEVVQRCVVTLAPVAGHVEESFTELLAPEGYEPPEDLDSDDLPEIFDGHEIDIGELAAQLLSLSLDPYPRQRDAGLELPVGEEPNETERRKPFEGLADMLKKRN
jgi:uncharacterized metal-binding protein YceD (DUF177 family)